MPNHCEQQMSISGPKEDRDLFVQQAKDDDGFSLRVFHPMPEELKHSFSGFMSDPDKAAEYEKQHAENTAKYGHPDWYSWANAEWGTKWGDYDGDISTHDEYGTRAYYMTAWGPATELVAKVSAKFPTLLFVVQYSEPGCGFGGVTAFRAGVVLRDEEVPMPDMDFSYEDDDYEEKYEAWEQSWMELLDRLEDEMECEFLGAVAP